MGAAPGRIKAGPGRVGVSMKITAVEAFHVDWGGGRNRSAWVRIRTDAGVDGLGEASPSHAAVTTANRYETQIDQQIRFVTGIGAMFTHQGKRLFGRA